MRYLLVLVVVFAAGCAQATAVTQFTVGDLRNAAKIATEAKDPVWAACMTALADHVQGAESMVKAVLENKDKMAEAKAFGLASAVVLAHEAYARRTISPELTEKCGPVALEILAFLIKVGAVAAPGGGVLGLLPIAH